MAAPTVEVLSRTPDRDTDAAWRPWRRVMTHTHTYSGRADHGGTIAPPENYRRLAEWAAARRIDALGMGSPYTPKSAARFQYYMTEGLAEYYAPTFNKRGVRDLDEIEAMVRDANRAGAGRTFFYLDNETPKGRYGHMWWVGYTCDYPAWHDTYQVFDQWMVQEQAPGYDGPEPMPYERRPYLEVVATQRAQGGVGFWAHPTSWWRGDRGQFITNLASEMSVHAIAEGRLDGMVIMGYQAYRPQYLGVWFHFLDHGFRVPGVAEMDCGLSDAGLYARDNALVTAVVPGEGALTVRRLVEAYRSGRLFATSGPLVDLSVDGKPMGAVAETAADRTHRVRLTAHPAPGQDVLGRVELVGRGGKVLWTDENVAGGTVELGVPGAAEAGYLVARVFGAGEGGRPVDTGKTKHVAISNPVYLHPPGRGFAAPATTRVRVTVREGSRFQGGEIRFEGPAGDVLSRAIARAGTFTETLPATSRVTMVATNDFSVTDSLANSSERVIELQRYLYRGRFLRDFPKCGAGSVPPEAWKIDDLRDAMREMDLAY